MHEYGQYRDEKEDLQKKPQISDGSKADPDLFLGDRCVSH